MSLMCHHLDNYTDNFRFIYKADFLIMFSMRKRFRKPLGFFFLIVFCWMFVYHDNIYQETNSRKYELYPNDHNSVFTQENVKRHENAESVIFSQGIYIPHSSNKLIHSQSMPLSGQVNDTKFKGNGKKKAEIYFDRSSINSAPLSLKASAKAGKLPSANEAQESLVSQNPPLRYKNAIGLQEYSDTVVEEGPLPPISTYHKISPLWMRITNDIYVYSAFWDHRLALAEGPVARILGFLRFTKEILHDDASYVWNGNVKAELLNCSCLLWYQNIKRPEKGVLKAFIFEERRQVFAGTFFFCYPQDRNESRVNVNKSAAKNGTPYAVSLHPNNSINASHKLLYLNYNQNKNVDTGLEANSTGVCVRSLYGPYNDVRGMVQFISYYYTVLNVSHFYIYDLASEPQIFELIGAFRSLGLTIEVLPWNIPTTEWGELWDIGSLTALNDCVYRSSGRHAIVAIVDLDEFIVPKTPVANLIELYRNVLTFRRGHYGDAVLISNAFFCFEFKGPESVKRNFTGFPLFDYTRRETRLWPPKSRSKMLVVPETVLAVGHHIVNQFLLKDYENRSSPKLISVLNHYRTCKDLHLGIFGTGKPVLSQGSIIDATVMKYKKAVMNSKTIKLYKRYFQ